MPSFITHSATLALVDAMKTRALSVPPAVKEAMQVTALALVSDMKVRMRSATGTVGIRSGNLRNQLTQRTDLVGMVIKTDIGDSVKYARIQEYGGTITPTRAQYLAIPVGPALTAAGVSKYASPREVPGLFVIRSKGGTLLLVRKDGQQLVTYFVLKKSVTLKPKLGLRDAIRKFFVGEGTRFDVELKRQLGKVMRGQ